MRDICNRKIETTVGDLKLVNRIIYITIFDVQLQHNPSEAIYLFRC